MQLSKNDKRSLIFCGIFLVVVFGYFYGVSPLMDRYDDAVADVQDIQGKIDNWNRDRSRLRFRRELNELTATALQKWLDRKQIDLLEGQRITRSIADLQSVINITKSSLHDLRPLTIQSDPQSSFETISFSMAFSGSYEQVLRCLYLIESAPALQVILSATVVPKAQQIEVRLEVERYFVKRTDPDTGGAGKLPDKVFVVATTQRVESGTLFIAFDKGYLKSDTTKYALLTTTTGMVNNWMLQEESVDAVAIEGAPFLINPMVPAQFVPVYQLCSTHVPVGLVTGVHSQIHTVNDLAGKTVALDLETFQQVMLVEALTEQKMVHPTVSLVPHVAHDETASAIRAGILDTAIFTEPWLSRTQASDKVNTVLTKAPAFPLDAYFLVAGPEHTRDEKHGDILFLMKAIAKAQQFWKENPEEGDQIVSRYLYCDPALVKTCREQLVFYPPKENLAQLKRWKQAVNSKKVRDAIEKRVEAWGAGQVVIDPGMSVEEGLLERMLQPAPATPEKGAP